MADSFVPIQRFGFRNGRLCTWKYAGLLGIVYNGLGGQSGDDDELSFDTWGANICSESPLRYV